MHSMSAKMRYLSIWVLIVFIITYLLFASSSMVAAIVKPRRVRCRLIGSLCFNVWHKCPADCPRTCLMDCGICKTVCSCNRPGAICEDPRFIGGDGITFYFHGRKDRDFCLVSDPNLHINAHFIGKRNPNLTRDFTWVHSIGIIFDNHKLLVAAKKTSMWDDTMDRLAISFDDTPVILPTKVGSMWHSPDEPLVTITRTSDTNRVTLEVSNNFRVAASVVPITAEESRVHNYGIDTKEDCFAHLELGFKFYNLTDEVDGVLGQTYKKDYVSKAKVNNPMPVMGGTHKFSSSGIFATDCRASRFGQNSVSSSNAGSRHVSLQCGSEAKGIGVVCKK